MYNEGPLGRGDQDDLFGLAKEEWALVTSGSPSMVPSAVKWDEAGLT